MNAANGSSHVSLQRAYIAVLEQLTPLEAVLLQKIYSLPYDKTRHDGVEVGKLPDEVEPKANEVQVTLAERPKDWKTR